MKFTHQGIILLCYSLFIAAAAGTAAVAAEDSASAHSRGVSSENTLRTAGRLLAQESDRERQPERFLIEELRSSGEVRETLEVIYPAQAAEGAEDVEGAAGDPPEPRYYLNGKRIDPEKDSMGRFDKFEERFAGGEDEESEEEDNRREESTPLYRTLRGEHNGTYEYVEGRRTLVWDIEFDTAGGDLLEGTLYTLPDSGVPVRLYYEANTPMLISAKTDSYYSPAADGTLQREALEIHFRIGALFLSRTYRMRMEF